MVTPALCILCEVILDHNSGQESTQLLSEKYSKHFCPPNFTKGSVGKTNFHGRFPVVLTLRVVFLAPKWSFAWEPCPNLWNQNLFNSLQMVLELVDAWGGGSKDMRPLPARSVPCACFRVGDPEVKVGKGFSGNHGRISCSHGKKAVFCITEECFYRRNMPYVTP